MIGNTLYLTIIIQIKVYKSYEHKFLIILLEKEKKKMGNLITLYYFEINL